MAGETGRNQVYATAAVLGGAIGLNASAIQFHLEAKGKEVASEETRVEFPPATAPAPQAMPKNLKDAKLRWVPPPAAPPAKPIVTKKVTYFNPTTPLGGAGGVGPGFLQDWVGKFALAAGEATQGGLFPATKVSQTIQGTFQGGQGGRGGSGGSSSSSSASSASAAAAAAAE